MSSKATLVLAAAALLASTACSHIDDLAIETNPVCDISAVMSWTTQEPASSWVEVEHSVHAPFRVGSDELVTEHEVVVVGMRAERSYALEAVSVTENGTELRSEATSFDTGSLPEEWYQGETVVHEPSSLQPGWTLANIIIASLSPIAIVMLDESGHVVWYYSDENEAAGADVVATWLDDRQELLVGPHVAPGEHAFRMDLQGKRSWEGPEQPGDEDLMNLQHGQWHHVLDELPNGDHITVVSTDQDVDGDDVQGDRVVQFDADNQEVWSWNAFDHLDYDPDDLYLGIWWTHLNSVAVDLDEDVVYINSWVMNKTFEVGRATGEILWTLGEGGDFAADPDAETPWYEKSHSFEPIGDDRYLLYDNGDHDRGWSRVVEYQLDEDAMQAEIVWEYPGELAEDEWWVISAGDVDLLDNGNRLVVADHRIMELSFEGDILWEYTWIPAEPLHDTRSYQAQRMPSLVEAL